VTDLHLDPPLTLGLVHRRARWLLPVAGLVFVLLGVGAALEALPWDEPITEEVVESRGDHRDSIAERISWFGSTPVVLGVAAGAAAAAFRRCPRLAIAIFVLALARPLSEWGLKELISRDRPPEVDRLVAGRGKSFPSGHPFATALSWGLVPLVVALFTGRRLLWWVTTVAVWTLAVAVAVSRVWLGVHWTSDAIGGLLLAVLAVAGAEWLIAAAHDQRRCAGRSP
jgi:undecaprenyl-diphosphatase